jgi:hypothetical protein
MAIFYPDILEHNNTANPLMNSSSLKGGALAVSSISERNTIPINKRTIGHIVSQSGTTARFDGLDVTDPNWTNALNWTDLGGSAIITQTITDGDTTHAPSGEAVYEGLLLKGDKSVLDAHIANMSNPHNTTALQVPATPHVDYLTGSNVQTQLDQTETSLIALVKTDKTDFKNLYQTGRSRPDTDVSVLSISPADTLNITAVDNILFINEIVVDTPANKIANFLLSFGNKSFVVNATNTPLAVNTRGVFYVGINKLGNAVFQGSKVYDQDTCYLARMIVANTAGVYSIVSFKYFPDLANNRVNNRDRLVLSSGTIVPSGAASISFGNRGVTFSKNSINYANNKLDPNYLTIADTVNPTPMQFLFALPNLSSLATSIALSTVINPTQWYNAGGTVGAGAVANTNYQVYKLLVTVTGTMVIQTKASTSNAPAFGVNAIFANRDDAIAGLTSTVFADVLPAGDSIALGTFYLRAGTPANGSLLGDPNDFYFRPITATSSSSSVGVTAHDALTGKNDNVAFQHVTTTDIGIWNSKPSGSGSPNYIAKWGSASNLGTGVMYDDGANVGIGTNSPFYKLHVSTTSNLGFKVSSTSTNRGLVFGADGGEPSIQGVIDNSDVPRQLILNPLGGNVGIGTITPSTNLHIHATADAILTLSSSAGAYSSTIRLNALGGGGAAIDSVGGTGALYFNINGSNKMFINSNGSVGIGTNSPLAQLDVRKPTDGATSIRASNTSGGYAEIGITDSVKSTGYINFTNSLALMGGNVGIGTDTPNRSLHIKGIYSEPLLLSSTNGTTNLSGILFEAANTTYTPFIGVTGNDFIIHTTGLERLRVNSSGNVLIGMTSDIGGKLQVYGGATFNQSTETSFINTRNDNGNFYFGKNNSTGTSLGSIPYANVLYGDGLAPFIVYVNGGERLRLSYDGIADFTGNIQFSGGGLLAPPSGVGYCIFPQSGVGLGLSSVAQGIAFWVGNTPVQRMIITASGLSVNGTVTASSDIRLKTNIKPLENSLSKVLKTQGVNFDRTDNEDKNQIGFIAQDLEKVFPELVKTDDSEEKIKSVNYQAMVAVLVEAIKELEQRVLTLESK